MNEETKLEIQNAINKGFSKEEIVEALNDVTVEDVEKIIATVNETDTKEEEEAEKEEVKE